MRKWIDEIILGLIEEVGSNKVDDILSHLGIHALCVNPDAPILQGNRAMYNRIGEFECIYYANDLDNKDFIIAHELGHAVLHVEETMIFYNPYRNRGKVENEANYFATKLLYSNIKFDDWIETKSDIAKALMISEECVEYLIN